MAEDVRDTAAADNGVLKRASQPDMHDGVQVPGLDFWAKVQADINSIEHGRRSGPRPPNSFTIKEFQEHTNLSDTQARRRINSLIKMGKYRKEGHVGSPNYYMRVDDDDTGNR